MNPDDLKRLFPNASADTLARNRGQLPNDKFKHNKASTLGSANEGKTQSIQRVRVRFVGYRVRPLDPDNFAGSVKDCLDFLRHAHLIDGDEPWRITLETEQVKVKTFKEEKLLIKIDRIEI